MGSCLSGETAASAAHPSSPGTPDSRGQFMSPSRKRMLQMKRSDSKVELRLHRVPGRFFLNSSTDISSMFSKQGKKGLNQDSMVVWQNFGSKGERETVFCGVFDGHGPNGHMVAKKVRDSLPLKLRAQLELSSSCKEHGDTSGIASGSVKYSGESVKSIDAERSSDLGPVHRENQSDLFQTLKESFFKAFKVMDKELKLHPYIDCYCSGTTAVTMIKQGQDLVIGNIGDSRAVLGTRDKDNSLIAVQLTEDHKPNLPTYLGNIYDDHQPLFDVYKKEGLNIIVLTEGNQRGSDSVKDGFFSLPAEPELFRMWLPNSYSPGLAMARAFGDFCLKGYGLISTPDVSHHRVTEKDEFVVLATDGLWDVLSNEEVVDLVASTPRASAARALVESANRTWRTRYPTAKVDDCAVVCLFLDSGSTEAMLNGHQNESKENLTLAEGKSLMNK